MAGIRLWRGGIIGPMWPACLTANDGPLLEAMAASRYAIGRPAFTEQTEGRIEQRRTNRVQDEDLDLPRWTVDLEEIDAAVARRYGVEVTVLKAHGHHAGPSKAVAVALAASLANMTCRAIAEHYGVGSSAVSAIQRRLADRPEVIAAVESLSRELRRKSKKRKCKVRA